MDKFVIRSKKIDSKPSERRKPIQNLKQAKLENLRGVVKVKEIGKAAKVLSVSEDRHEILEILGMLSQKVPSIQILKDSGIGRIVRKLSKDKDLVIASKAEDVYEKWKEHVEKISSRKPVEVSSDEQTKERRDKAREHISKHLESDLSERLEHEIYKSCGQLLNQRYRKAVRKLVLALEHRQGFKDSLLKERTKFRQYLGEFI